MNAGAADLVPTLLLVVLLIVMLNFIPVGDICSGSRC